MLSSVAAQINVEQVVQLRPSIFVFPPTAVLDVRSGTTTQPCTQLGIDRWAVAYNCSGAPWNAWDVSPPRFGTCNFLNCVVIRVHVSGLGGSRNMARKRI